MAPQYTLYYFNAKGAAEPIRLIFAHAKVKFEDVRVEGEEWPKLKETMPWGTVPVLDVDGVKLSQARPIGRFLARKYGLSGESDMDQAKCEEYVGVWADITTEYWKYFLESDPTKKAEKAKLLEEEVFPKYLTKFEAILKSNGNGLLVGKKLTFADIYIAYLADLVADMKSATNVMGKFPLMKKHAEMVSSLPGIREWIATRPD